MKANLLPGKLVEACMEEAYLFPKELVEASIGSSSKTRNNVVDTEFCEASAANSCVDDDGGSGGSRGEVVVLAAVMAPDGQCIDDRVRYIERRAWKNSQTGEALGASPESTLLWDGNVVVAWWRRRLER